MFIMYCCAASSTFLYTILISPRVHLVAFGLLQLSCVRHLQHRLRRLQAIQNAAARLVIDTRRCEHITEVVQQHTLRQRVKYKLTVLDYKALNNLAPPYLSDDWRLVATGAVSFDHQTISSALLFALCSRVVDQAFAAVGPLVWNSLPPHVRRLR